MADTAQPLTNGPAESEFVRRVFYLGEGIIIGVVLHAIVYVAVSVAPAELFHPIHLLMAVWALFILVPLLYSYNDWERTPLAQEWHDIRRWRHVFLLGSLGTVLLVGSSVLAWGWTWPKWRVVPVMMGLGLLGVLLRVAGIYLVEQHNPDLKQTY